jgi:hypothetical protein
MRPSYGWTKREREGEKKEKKKGEARYGGPLWKLLNSDGKFDELGIRFAPVIPWRM